MRITKPAQAAVATSSISAASHTGSVLVASQSREYHIIKKTTIHLSDLGANRFPASIPASILSILEKMSISRGKIILLDMTPAATLSTAQAITTVRVPVEKPPIMSPLPMNPSSVTMLRPRTPPSKRQPRSAGPLCEGLNTVPMVAETFPCRLMRPREPGMMKHDPGEFR